MSDPIFQNDDDLFNYDPSKDSSKHLDFSSSTSSDKNKENQIYSHISKNIDNNDDDALDGVNGLRVKFSQAVIGSYDYWIASALPVAYTSTINDVMDQLTGGRFSDLYLYNYLEINIIRRINIIGIMDDAFSSASSSASDSFKTFMKKIGVDITDSYVPVYIGTLTRITSHILAQERSMYLSLAEKLQVTPNPAVLDSNFTQESALRNARLSVQQSQRDLIDNKFIQNSDSNFFDRLNNMNTTQINHALRSL